MLSARQCNQSKPNPNPRRPFPLQPGYQACTQTNSFDIVMHSCAAARPGLACSVCVSILLSLTVASLKQQLKSTAGRWESRQGGCRKRYN